MKTNIDQRGVKYIQLEDGRVLDFSLLGYLLNMDSKFISESNLILSKYNLPILEPEPVNDFENIFEKAESLEDSVKENFLKEFEDVISKLDFGFEY